MPEPSVDESPLQVAVIGAGLSGLTAASTLMDLGHSVEVFEKGRGPGGRMSTRRSGSLSFDHGAQYFTVQNRGFRDRVLAWRDRGLVSPWSGRVVVLDQGRIEPERQPPERFVGAPGMNAVCAHLARDLEVRFNVRVTRLEQRGARWLVRGDANQVLGSFDAVVVSAPSPQTAVLLSDVAPRLAARAEAVEMQPCWAVMVAFGEPLELGFDGAFVQNAPLRWVCRNTSKEGRPEAEAWVLHASPEWSEKHIELDHETVVRHLLATFGDSVQRPLPAAAHLIAHRWRFALPFNPLSEDCLHEASLAVFACGDWCGGPKVEGAYLSGRAAAARVLETRMKASRAPRSTGR